MERIYRYSGKDVALKRGKIAPIGIPFLCSIA